MTAMMQQMLAVKSSTTIHPKNSHCGGLQYNNCLQEQATVTLSSPNNTDPHASQ